MAMNYCPVFLTFVYKSNIEERTRHLLRNGWLSIDIIRSENVPTQNVLNQNKIISLV